MPAIKAFKGVRYDFKKVSPDRVVAPPYDVIDESLRGRLYERDPHNVVRIILGKGADPYADAARYILEWSQSGILRRDTLPSIYLLEQEFTMPDGGVSLRSGFIAACRVEEFGGSVLPHEKTHSGPKEDRLRLMNATGMMFSQIFSLYSDPEGRLDAILRGAKQSPADDVSEYEGIVNRVWLCQDQAVALEVSAFMRDLKVLVADGHHRYETALAYRDSRRMKNPKHDGHEPYNFVPMFFCNMHDPGMQVLPTHRLLREITDFDGVEFLRKISQYFSVSEYPSLEGMTEGLMKETGSAVGMALSSSGKFYVVVLRPEGHRLLEGLPGVVRRLDVTMLHDVILGKILGLSAVAQEKKTNLEYERDSREALRLLRDGNRQAAFFMRPTPLDDVRMVAEAGQTLPQKSTYFFPKLLSGLVNYVFEGEERW